MLKINCPKCRREIEIPAEKIGEVASCEFCRAYFVTERVRTGDQPSAPSDPECVPEKDTSFVSSSMSGDFKGIEYGGGFFSGEAILRLNRRFCVFTVLVLFQLACLIAIVNPGIIDVVDSEIPLVACFMILLTFVPLSVVYAMLLRAMQVSGRRYKLSLSVFWLIPPLLVVRVFMPGKSAFIPGAVPVLLLLVDIILRLSNLLQAAAILKAAKDLPFRGNRFVRTMKRCSFLSLPLLFFLLVSVFFLGSVKRETFLCSACEIYVETNTVCFLGAPLLTFSQKTPTRDTESLDPEHRCRHRIGRASSSSDVEYYFLRPVIHDIILVVKPKSDSTDFLNEIPHY